MFFISIILFSAKKFNQPLDNWVTSSAINMSQMFYQAIEFDQPLTNFDTKSVTKNV